MTIRGVTMENEYDRLDKHILVRFSDKHNLFAHNGAIKEHNEILKKNGHVWFGKLGRKLSNKNISDLNLQIQKKYLPFCFWCALIIN